MAPYVWVEQIEAELAAGAWKVIAEARETGTAGIYRPDGEVRMGLIDEIAHAVAARAAAVRGAAQGAAGVVPAAASAARSTSATSRPRDVLSLETLRLGLRADTASDRRRPEQPAR